MCMEERGVTGRALLPGQEECTLSWVYLHPEPKQSHYCMGSREWLERPWRLWCARPLHKTGRRGLPGQEQGWNQGALLLL